MTEGGEQRITDAMGSESVFDFYCEFCREDGKMLEADGYCVDCGEYLCDTCYACHRRSRPYRHHVLMDKDSMPKDTPLSEDRVNKGISKLCYHHPGKPVEYCCREHNSLGCHACILKSHRNCNSLENIPEVSESIMESQEFKTFIELLNQLDQRARSNITLVQDNLANSHSWCTEVKKSLQKFREEINSILDQLQKSITAQAENIQKEEEMKLSNVSNQVATSLQSVEQIVGEVDLLQKSRNVCEIYIKLHESKSELKAIQTSLDDVERQNVVSEYVFDPNTKLKEFLNSQKGIGKLSVQDSVASVAVTQVHCNSVKTKAIYVTTIDVASGKGERESCVTGSAVVSNRLLVTDDFSKVKLIDTQSNTVVSELTVSKYPWDVTIIGRNQAAVTLYTSKKIFLVHVSDILTLNREITVGGKCHGVAYSKDRLIVTYTNPGQLEIMDLYNGKTTKVVKNDTVGNKLFQCPRHVCVSKDEESIYISDCESDKITSLTFDGVVKSVYSDSELRGPEKVCVDHHGNVYVCGCTSRNIHMLTADLTKIQIILTQADGLDGNVYSVSHCQETNRLYVGMQNNTMKVYQLSQ